MMKKIPTLFLSLFLMGHLMIALTGCQSSPPILEYTLAQAAMLAAQKANAIKFAPGYWTRAEQAYQEGKNHFQQKRYKQASRAFKQAHVYAEQSENISRAERLKSGEPP